MYRLSDLLILHKPTVMIGSQCILHICLLHMELAYHSTRAENMSKEHQTTNINEMLSLKYGEISRGYHRDIEVKCRVSNTSKLVSCPPDQVSKCQQW